MIDVHATRFPFFHEKNIFNSLLIDGLGARIGMQSGVEAAEKRCQYNDVQVVGNSANLFLVGYGY